MSKKHNANGDSRAISALELVQIELARMVASSLGLSWGQGIDISEHLTDDRISETKIKIASAETNNQPTIVYATFIELSSREWVPTGHILVISGNSEYASVCRETEEGTYIAPLWECVITDPVKVKKVLAEIQ